MSPTESESTATHLHKIHIYGVDDLTTNDINLFSSEHFPSNPPIRVEWIDDQSANLVFQTPAIALEALEKLSLTPDGNESPLPTLQLRKAKGLSTHPGSILQIRTALLTDRKRPRAYEASRFYMMHPEHDPREKRLRDMNHSNNSKVYRRRYYGDEEYRRRKRKAYEERFESSVYDDSATSSRHGSLISSQDGISEGAVLARPRRYRDSYRPARHGRDRNLRDRSASPDGFRCRQHTPAPSYHTLDPHLFPDENEGKELFPLKRSEDTQLRMKGKGLCSNKILEANTKKDLFPHKINVINHRRSDAFDAADETADLFASGLLVPFSDGAGIVEKSPVERTADKSQSYGRLKGADAEPLNDSNNIDNGLNIRGMSKEQGYSIRGGGAARHTPDRTIKELFPGRAGNTGKELFAGKLQGRRGNRNRADMFY